MNESASAPGFYGSYARFKNYTTPVLGAKEKRRFDAMVWQPGACQTDHRFLELGCGAGAFLDYLVFRGCAHVLGVDHDPALRDALPEAVRERFLCRDLLDALADPATGTFDRIVALDVLEHFSPEDGLRLLSGARDRLAPGGRIVLKVPNAASPWGLAYQFGDLTHCTAFAPSSLGQLAEAAGLGLVAVLPSRHGSRRRLLTDALVHRFLSWALLTPPAIWTANMVAVLEKP